MRAGSYRESPGPPDCLVYERRVEGQTMFVALNFGTARVAVNLPVQGRIVAATGEREGMAGPGDLVLGPTEGVVIESV